MRQVRGRLREHSNLLDLGPLHAHLLDHLKKMISNIDIVLGAEATYNTASLDGRPFERPEAFYAVQAMIQDPTTYPHLQRLLIAFLHGALKTFTRFTSEFGAGSVIAGTTPTQRDLARMETTNDANEGALGTLRVTFRRAPRMSLAQFNARLKYKKNNTKIYMKKFLGKSARQYLRRKARVIDASSAEKKRRLAQAKYDQQLAQRHRVDDERKRKKRDAAAVRLAAVVPRLTEVELASMRVSDIDLQLRWHRQFDEKVPRAKEMPKKKEDKLRELRHAVERHNDGSAASRTESNCTNGGDVIDDEYTGACDMEHCSDDDL